MTGQDETIVSTVLARLARSSSDDAEKVWSAMVNVLWVELDSPVADYTAETSGEGIAWGFREAARLISGWRGEDNYMDWYCCGPQGEVSPEIVSEMEAVGYRPVPTQ